MVADTFGSQLLFGFHLIIDRTGYFVAIVAIGASGITKNISVKSVPHNTFEHPHL